jgi:hypothetical protein
MCLNIVCDNKEMPGTSSVRRTIVFLMVGIFTTLVAMPASALDGPDDGRAGARGTPVSRSDPCHY